MTKKRVHNLSFTSLAGLVLTLFVYQNCAKVTFTSSDKPSETPQSTQSQPEKELEDNVQRTGGTHGDGYEGKVTRFLHFSELNECQEGEISIKSEIRESLEEYTMVVEDCESIPARRLAEEDISLTDEGLTYQDNSYLVNYPNSCEDVYDAGGGAPNGFYLIDPDGDGPEPAGPTYCDMPLVSGGWSSWSAWSDCDVTCGEGQQTRSRSCNTGGCQGEATEQRLCQAPPCK